MRLVMRWILFILGAGMGGVLLPFVVVVYISLFDFPRFHEQKPARYPAPWRMPPYPGMGSLRLAMVHDVLSERFPTRSTAWHAARVAALQALLPAPPADPATARFTAEQLPLIDDLGISLDRLGRPAEAIPWFRAKAAAQGLPWPPPPVDKSEPEPVTHESRSEKVVIEVDDQYLADLRALARRGTPDDAAHQRYTTWANLGTVLVHANLRGALAGEAAARQAVGEGLAALRQAVATEPAAHFGRERWQITLAEHLLAAGANPTLLRRFDAGGEPLVDGDVPRAAATDIKLISQWLYHDPGKPLVPTGDDHRFRSEADATAADRAADDERRQRVRSGLTTVGADRAWAAVVHPTWSSDAAWDQPALGAIGLWTLGGGASPHLALWLATTCERIGQRHLALEAWLRVEELAERYSPAPDTVAWLRTRAAGRITALAASLHLDPSGLQQVRERFAAELAWARGQRTKHDAWEAAQLAAGRAWDDPALDAWRPDAPLASDPGSADEVWVRRQGVPFSELELLCLALLGGGLGGWIVLRPWSRRRAATRPASPSA